MVSSAYPNRAIEQIWSCRPLNQPAPDLVQAEAFDLHHFAAGLLADNNPDRAPAQPQPLREKFAQGLVRPALQRGRAKPQPELVSRPSRDLVAGRARNDLQGESARVGHTGKVAALSQRCQAPAA